MYACVQTCIHTCMYAVTDAMSTNNLDLFKRDSLSDWQMISFPTGFNILPH